MILHFTKDLTKKENPSYKMLLHKYFVSDYKRRKKVQVTKRKKNQIFLAQLRNYLNSLNKKYTCGVLYFVLKLAL